jgi:hypothetical protein
MFVAGFFSAVSMSGHEEVEQNQEIFLEQTLQGPFLMLGIASGNCQANFLCTSTSHSIWPKVHPVQGDRMRL